MRGARDPHHLPTLVGSADSLAGILTEVASELRAIRQSMESRNA
jgi:hypothetical protein